MGRRRHRYAKYVVQTRREKTFRIKMMTCFLTSRVSCGPELLHDAVLSLCDLDVALLHTAV